MKLSEAVLDELSGIVTSSLIHAVDVEGKSQRYEGEIARSAG